MSIGLKDYQSNVFEGLGTFTYTVTSAGPYFVSAHSSIDHQHSVSVVINQNASPKHTSSVPAAHARVNQSQVSLNCAVNDVITVVLSSALAADAQPNSIKTIIVIRKGN